ncbi:hypothetical protein TNCV_870321 [Trichonephila clavipes]|nr:hypothetical protein TNCV_870321 [Trichonephila clavipes]
MILHVGYRSFFLDIFWMISSTTLAPDQLALQSDDRLNHLISSEKSTHAQSCSVIFDAHDTIANGQYGAVWSMGHIKQVCVRMGSSPQTSGNSFREFAFLRQQEIDLPPAELWCACLFFAEGIHICLLQASYFDFPPCRLLHIPKVFK